MMGCTLRNDSSYDPLRVAEARLKTSYYKVIVSKNTKVNSEGTRLARFSEAVRESSLKRLRAVPEKYENWRPTHEGMSFADIAQHLINPDNWLFKMLDLKNLKPIVGKPGLVEVTHRSQYLKLLDQLRQTGVHRSQLLESITPDHLSEMIFDHRYGKKVSVWWIIVRGNLDRKIRHTGQIATYLRILSRSNLPG